MHRAISKVREINLVSCQKFVKIGKSLTKKKKFVPITVETAASPESPIGPSHGLRDNLGGRAPVPRIPGTGSITGITAECCHTSRGVN